jgi:putative DNA primase/helicase
METRIDTTAVLSRVDIVDVIDAYVPLKKNGTEFEACCPFHTEATPSFKVSPGKQFYHCFGCGANGDAIKFLREYKGLSFQDAVRELGGEVPDTRSRGATTGTGVTPAPRQRETPPRDRKPTPWVAVLPAPAGAPEPPRAHIKRGLPERTWCYRDGEGRLLGYVYRFKTSDGGKEVLPLVWARHGVSGVEEWHWLAFPEPRPLYGLDRLAAKPDATVLLVEGEKCADAAAAELPDLVVVSWPGGGKAIGKVAWAPMAGRRVILWADCDAKRVPLTKAERDALPDAMARALSQAQRPLLPEAEQPGVKTMSQIAEILQGLGCRLWRVEISAPGEKPDGWDVADAIADDGLAGEALAAFVRAQSRPLAAARSGGEDVAVGSDGVSTPPPAGAGGGFGGGGDEWRRLLLRKDDRVIDCRENIYLMLKHHPAWAGVVRANTFARKIVKLRPPPWQINGGFRPGEEWVDDDNLRLGLWLAQQERLLVRAADNLGLAAGWAAREATWHPVLEYLERLAWDGVPRIDDWLTDFLGCRKNEYTVRAGRYFLIGMVARIFEPGCILRSMPILEGPQFQGKSSALRILGGEWYGDTTLDLQSKDVYQVIHGCWIYEIAELDAFNRADSTRIKAFISSLKDRFRAPYDRDPADHLRQTVFAGTTNQDEYFKDQTGNTRYWPWQTQAVEAINLDGLAASRDQLIAEAVVAYRAGQRWHPTREEQQRLFEPEQESREIMDPWEKLICDWLRARVSPRVTTNEILFECLKIEPGKVDSTRQMSTRVGIAVKRLGWHKKRETEGGRGYYYLRPAGWGPVAGSAGASDEPF